MSSAGKVLIRPRGNYDATATYMVLDIVYYNRKEYIAKQTTTGNLPTNTTYWQLFAENVENMDDLEDVEFTNPTDGQVPLYNGTTGKWENSDPPSSGHVIEDESGTQLAQQEVLKFDGYLKATNDATNGKTVIDDTPEEVTWAVWQTMSAAQKAGKKWLITGIPGGNDPVRASDVIYRNTDVETELDKINTDLSKNNFPTLGSADVVDLSTYTTDANLFTCPSDGYLWCVGGTTASLLYAMGANGTGAATSTYITLLAPNGTQTSLFVRKGMKTRSQAGYTNNVKFVPLQ